MVGGLAALDPNSLAVSSPTVSSGPSLSGQIDRPWPRVIKSGYPKATLCRGQMKALRPRGSQCPWSKAPTQANRQ